MEFQSVDHEINDANFENEIIKESFQSLAAFLNEQSPIIEGALIAFDHSGQIVDFHYISEPITGLRDLLSNGKQWNGFNMGPNAIHTCIKSMKLEHMKWQKHTVSELQHLDSLAMPIYSNSEQLVAILGLLIQPKIQTKQDSIFLLQTFGIAFQSFMMMNMEKKMNRKFEKRDMLFQVAKQLHSKIDVDSIIIEVIESMKKIFPMIHIDLFLSQDNHSSNQSVKPLVFDDTGEDLCTRAFMAGVTLSSIQENGERFVAAPLSGKQGVYGVFQLDFKHEHYDENDLKFISMLADSAGSAFENARLYEQSNVLINELRLINEITRKLNQSLRLQDIFDFASKELISIFNAHYGCILKTSENKSEMLVQASNSPSIGNLVFSVDHGFSGTVYKTKEPVIISDYSKSRIESKLMTCTDSRSLIASPILIKSNVVGVILVTHREPNFFSYDNFKLLQVISGHIGLAITNASLHAEVRRMVITDNLTGLSARSYLDEQVNILQKKDFSGALIMVDLDYFKKVNDTFGHQVGDKVLIQVSQIIKSSIRDSDIAARWGGEELAIYLPQSTLEQTLRVAERIRKRIFEETDPQISVSCGVSQWNWEDDSISVENLFYRADMALYKAKNAGRNRIIVG